MRNKTSEMKRKMQGIVVVDLLYHLHRQVRLLIHETLHRHRHQDQIRRHGHDSGLLGRGRVTLRRL